MFMRLIELSWAAACVHGNVHYKVVEMRVGARLTGSLTHTNNQAALPPPDEPLSTHGIGDICCSRSPDSPFR